MVIKEVQKEVDWREYVDSEAMETTLKMERDAFTIAIEETSDHSTLIIPVVGQLNNWTWVGFSKNKEKKFCNASPDVLFNIFNKMNSDLAYFDVSHNIEILYLNDSNDFFYWNSNEFENEINKQLEKKIFNLWNQLLKLLIWAIMRIHAKLKLAQL